LINEYDDDEEEDDDDEEDDDGVQAFHGITMQFIQKKSTYFLHALAIGEIC